MMDEGKEIPKLRETPWKPDAAFYESDPRSKEVRATCVPAINSLNKLIYDPLVRADAGLRSSLYSQIQEANNRLVELGVSPSMHEGKPYEYFKSNPVVASEFLAGQLANIMGNTIPSESDAMAIIEEFSEGDMFGGKLVGEGAPAKSYEYMALRGALAFIEGNFDIKPENPKPPTPQSSYLEN